jgi:hypothetical protein
MSYSDDFLAPSWGIIFTAPEESTEVSLPISEFKPMGKWSQEAELDM